MRLKADSLASRIATSIVPYSIAWMQRSFSLTIKRRYLNQEPFLRIKEEGAYILGVWHASVLWAPFFHPYHEIRAMVSPSRDGELIARVIKSSGNYSVRGSSSRGGATALRTLLKELKRNHPICIVPDGPRGPAFRCQGGIVAAAMQSGKPIIPFHYEARPQWVARKVWDKHRLPRPFSTIYLCYGDPIFVPPKLKADEFEARRLIIEEAMMANMRRCQTAAGYAPGSDT